MGENNNCQICGKADVCECDILVKQAEELSNYDVPTTYIGILEYAQGNLQEIDSKVNEMCDSFWKMGESVHLGNDEVPIYDSKKIRLIRLRLGEIGKLIYLMRCDFSRQIKENIIEDYQAKVAKEFADNSLKTE